MKHALILHGTDANPDSNWFPWIKSKLGGQGYDVWAPLLPENHTPNRQVYGDFLLTSGFKFEDSILIGHSSGAVEVLNLLDDDRLPHVKLAVIVSAWAGEKPNGYETNEQFENLFPAEGFEFLCMQDRADNIVFFHGDDDPYCPQDRAQYLAEQLNAPLHVIHGGKHLGSNLTDFPELWKIIEPQV